VTDVTSVECFGVRVALLFVATWNRSRFSWRRWGEAFLLHREQTETHHNIGLLLVGTQRQ
jgi:hypothetical protein